MTILATAGRIVVTLISNLVNVNLIASLTCVKGEDGCQKRVKGGAVQLVLLMIVS